MTSSTDRIERKVLINAPVPRVWRALTDAEAFGGWFGVALKGKRFVAGQQVQGHITIPGFEHVVFDVLIDRVEPETLFSYRWHPYAVDPAIDYAKESTTLVVSRSKRRRAALCSAWSNPALTTFLWRAAQKPFA